jgi:hypothetical protein
MLEKDIDPTDYGWLDDDAGSVEYSDWLDDLAREYEEDEAAALHAYECRIYNEPDRRYAV